MVDSLIHKPKKRFGQHFLQDESVVNGIVEYIFSRWSPQHVVEIGPGKGALTHELLGKAGRLDIIELDRDLVKFLEQRFSSSSRLKIFSSDALKVDYCSLVQSREKLVVVGNLPYNISTPLLFYLLNYRGCICGLCFMLQREVVERMVSVPGKKTYGRLSVMVQYYFAVESLFNVEKEAFTPVPRVSSAVVSLTPYTHLPYQADNEELLSVVVRDAFCRRRKTIQNALKDLVESKLFEDLGIDPELRPESLSVKNFVDISNSINEKDK